MAKLSEEEKQRRALAHRTKSALAAEANAHRQEEKRRRWAEEGSYLTREELEAGNPVQRLRLAIIDELGDWPPLMLLTDEERTERERMNKAFTDRHPYCRSVRWSMGGSRTTHCGECCPPAPFGDRQIEAIAGLLQSVAASDPSDLDTCRLTLTCTHTVDRTQHRTNHSWTSSTVHCPDCWQTRGIVASEKLPPSFERNAAERARLDREIERTTQELERARRKTATVQRQLEQLEAERRRYGAS